MNVAGVLKVPLRVLQVEDNLAHVEMVRELLGTEGFEVRVRRVETARELEQALTEGNYDVIVSDCTMPAFHGLAALELARQRRPDIPFVFYSGTIGEEAAVESLKRGAMDFVPKGRPEKLGPTIGRVLRERRLDRERSLQQQRVQAVGTLSAGVAHALNHILTSVLIGAEQLGERLSDESDRRTLELMQASARRGSEIVRQVLDFARGTGAEKAVLDIKPLVEEVSGLMRELLPPSIQIQTRMTRELYRVEGNATELYQVLLNLSVNARDAMPAGGQLLIEATNVVLEARPASQERQPRMGPHVVVVVKDTGMGIAPEALGRIFEPFFTTKAVGQGAGLGLATAAEVVKRHGGFIEVTSHVGQGSVFEVYLPAATGMDSAS
ncbi:MAG: response regulator [Verrucomicrobia bacterium]|nr:response regulator [Verrucomicrobiota bacterium]